MVLAYAISPTRGSEYSVAWNYVAHMSKYCHLTVLYGTSGEHMGDCEEMEKFVANGGLKNVDFVFVKPDRKTNLLNWCNKHGFLGYTFYWAYHLWHKLAYKKASSLTKTRKFDLVHFVGPISYREPGFLWKLNLPYMWGPIGGGNQTNAILQKHTSMGVRIKFSFRNIANWVQIRFKFSLREALKNTDLLLTATTENQRLFERLLSVKSIYLPENAIATEIMLDKKKFDNPERYHILIVGSLIPRKAVHIALEAMAKMNSLDRVHLDVVGDGPLSSTLQQYAMENGLSAHITWHGQVSRNKVLELFKMAHVHLVTSLSEGNPTTIWEAMSCGVPTISFDHCGMHDIICRQCGVKIPIHDYEQCVGDLAMELERLIGDSQRLEALAEGVVRCAQNYTWNLREKVLLEYHDMVIDNFEKRI